MNNKQQEEMMWSIYCTEHFLLYETLFYFY